MIALITGLVLVLIIGLAWTVVRLLVRISRRVMDDGRSVDEATAYDVDPVGLGLACIGAAAMAIGAFLPLDQPGGRFAYVQSNTLIQHGGWALIALSVGIALDAFRCYQTGRRSWGVFAMGIIGLLIVIALAESKGLRTLYPVGTNGQPNQSAPGIVVPLGIAVYVSGVGASLAVIGGRLMRQRSTIRDANASNLPADAEATKRCPDCAETVLAGARVCKHCGYRFNADIQVTPSAREEP